MGSSRSRNPVSFERRSLLTVAESRQLPDDEQPGSYRPAQLLNDIGQKSASGKFGKSSQNLPISAMPLRMLGLPCAG